MNPSRSPVVSGVSVSEGSAATICATSLSALTSLPVAWPGWTSIPRTVTTADIALNVSSWSSPISEPSSVYAQSAPKRGMSNSVAPSPISSSGVNATRSVGRGSSGCAARYATAAMISATPALSSAPSRVSPLLVTRSCPILAVSSCIEAGSSIVPSRGNSTTPPP